VNDLELSTDVLRSFEEYDRLTTHKKRLARIGFIAKAKGNRCGHVVNAPLQFNPHFKPLKFLNDAVKRFRSFYVHPDNFPDLNSANNSDRQMRSCARDALCVVVPFLLVFMDVPSLRVLKRKSDGVGFEPFDLYYIAEYTGLSYWRVVRAVEYLKRAKYLTVHMRNECVTDEGMQKEFRGRPAVRRFTTRFFAELNLLDRLSKEQQRIYRKRKRENARRQLTYYQSNGYKLHTVIGSQVKTGSKGLTEPAKPRDSHSAIKAMREILEHDPPGK